jgi:anti-sigma regulatory factor (Ser/Thr protein kinase)
MQAHLQVSLEPEWPTVRDIRQRVGSALQNCPAQLRSAAVMASSELVENAIKYGESVPGAKAATFVLEVTGESVSIRVVNGSTNAVGVAELQRRVQELRGTADKQALYHARLQELLADEEETGNLGIYRIGFEGGFELELDYTNQVVTVTATRNANA